MKDFAFSKINLSLNVGKKRGEFHPIDSVVVSVDCHDTVCVTARADEKIVIKECKGVPQENNVVHKAVQEFCKIFGTNGCNVRIKKAIPIAAGLGGSSADVASVVRCLCKIYNVDVNGEQVHSLCASLGSDVNFLLHGGLARMTGKGDDLEFFPLDKTIYFAVTVFGVPLLAKDVYAQFDEMGGSSCNNDVLISALQCGDFSVLNQLCNGLQRAATSNNNFASKYLTFCENNSLPCCMTGSGSAFFVPFESKLKAKQAARKLCKAGFKTFLCKTYTN